MKRLLFIILLLFPLALSAQNHINDNVCQPGTTVNVIVTTDSVADIYIDDELVGRGSWTGCLSCGSHNFEARKALHITSGIMVFLTNGKDENIVIPAPVPNSMATDTDIPQDDITDKIPEFADEIMEKDVPYVVDNMPEFPGGKTKLDEYINDNVKYPVSAEEASIHGKVYVKFIVETDGSLSNVEVIRGIGGGCDEEAVRVVQNMPKWIPGKHRDITVRVYYLLRFIF